MPEVCPYSPTEQWTLGEFHIHGILGEGGSGTVYAATFHESEVALKVLRSDLVLSDRERKRFLEEAARMRRVEHVGLIAMLGAGELSDGRPYICMPRLEGETLASRLQRGRLPLDTALAVFDVMAGAVGTLHLAGLIHRDIKPENIFLEGPADPARPPHPILLDFGIARDVTQADSTTTVAGQLRGTPAYMAPERFFGSVANVRSDVYELAVTLYMMLVGRRPWDGAQDAAARLSPIHPRDAGVDLPADLVTVVLRALSTRPEVRPGSAEAFASAVRSTVATGGAPERMTTATLVSVPPPNAATPAGDPAATLPRNGRALPWVGAIVAVVLGVALMVVVKAQERSSPPAARPSEAMPAPASAAPTASAQPPSSSADSERAPQPPPTSSGVEGPAPPVRSLPSRGGANVRATPRVASPSPPPPASSAPPSPDRYYLDRK